MAFGVTDLKKGQIFQIDNQPYKVIDYAQKVMGRGGSIVNVKIKSLLDGKVLSKTFKGNESIEPADVVSKNIQYLYNDVDKHYFMDQETYEQYEILSDTIEDITGYLKEGDSVQAYIFNGSLISVDVAKNIPLKVTYTEAVVKGDTTNSVQKEAELETGVSVKVPSFIKTGDVISIDTDTGAYRERVSS